MKGLSGNGTGYTRDAADEHLTMAISALRFAADDLHYAQLAYAEQDLWALAGVAGGYLVSVQRILDNHDGEVAK